MQSPCIWLMFARSQKTMHKSKQQHLVLYCDTCTKAVERHSKYSCIKCSTPLKRLCPDCGALISATNYSKHVIRHKSAAEDTNVPSHASKSISTWPIQIFYSLRLLPKYRTIFNNYPFALTMLLVPFSNPSVAPLDEPFQALLARVECFDSEFTAIESIQWYPVTRSGKSIQLVAHRTSSTQIRAFVSLFAMYLQVLTQITNAVQVQFVNT